MVKTTEHWDNYWHNSRSLNSFGEGSVALGYTGNSQSYWYNIFNSTAADAVVLDLASGNGALAMLALDYSESTNKNFKVYACDLAAINPKRSFQAEPAILAKLDKIHFLPQTAIEKLPFSISSVDLLISQFGFEYASQADAFAECDRVLKPNGRFSALVHHADSFISRDSAAGLAFYRICLNNRGILAQVEQLLVLAEDCWHRGISPITVEHYVAQNKLLFQLATDLKEEYNSLAAAFWCDDLLSRLSRILASPRPGNLASFLSLKSSIILYIARLEEQLKATWSQADKEQFFDDFQSQLVALEVKPFYEEKRLFAWSLSWKKKT